ncbi:hypothetical protein [Lysinibacillus fusiformis]|uniref:hypothetical protein n=1 Tax=Lysinibacillus fusiformis TaxID=28031 RepID=UPI00263BE7AE|nr:hypothetical protein [Lysinibacillus fusiformis]MDC6268041.1 hypothetical protein [Lysinibacillus sphaericus]MDN4967469.1 hypothetical protein [Lysinibacillus fusiformis]
MVKKVQVSREVADAAEVCNKFSRAMLISHVSSIYAGFTMVDKSSTRLAKLLVKDNYELEEVIQICFGEYEVKETPVERFNYFYDKYSRSDILFEKDFLGGMLAVAEWFDLPVKGRE